MAIWVPVQRQGLGVRGKTWRRGRRLEPPFPRLIAPIFPETWPLVTPRGSEKHLEVGGGITDPFHREHLKSLSSILGLCLSHLEAHDSLQRGRSCRGLPVELMPNTSSILRCCCTRDCELLGHALPLFCSVAKSCLTLCDPVDCNPPGSSVHGIFQAKILEWVAISSSRGYSRPRDQPCVSCIGRRILYI